jgi:hypothetical protein
VSTPRERREAADRARASWAQEPRGDDGRADDAAAVVGGDPSGVGKAEDDEGKREHFDPRFTIPRDPGVVDWMTAHPAVVAALLERAEAFAEWAIRVYAMTEVKPCWRLHTDVTLLMSNLERAYFGFHHDADPTAPGLWDRRREEARDLWRNTTMKSCSPDQHKPRLQEFGGPITARRAHYWSPATAHAAFTYPFLDEAGRPYGGHHLDNDGVLNHPIDHAEATDD